MKYIDPNLIKSLANILYIMITNGPVNLKPLKYYVKGYKNRVKALIEIQQGLEIRGFWFQKKTVQRKSVLREVYTYVVKWFFFQKTV